jgi:acetylornithine deacetylase/succinyl-diaminopimelate desuccinylase-like protein
MIEAIEKKWNTIVDDLKELLSYPSISTYEANKEILQKTAEFVVSLLNKAGFENIQIFNKEGAPIVFAELIVDKNLPTVLMYGHYDVQPPDPLELWETEPFCPTIKNNKIYARGASDDKGQFLTHIKAVEILKERGELKYNIKIVVEGEEEIGSPSLYNFVKKHSSILKADVILISDTSIYSNDQPTITTGLRGLVYFELEVQGPNRDLHSGVYGGAVMNPIHALCEIISKLKNNDGEIAIPGFYDKVVQLSDVEREKINSISFDTLKYKQNIGIEQLNQTKNYSILELIGTRPSFDVNGIWGGYTGQGSKTIIPSKAHAKISMRLVPNQDPQEIAHLFISYVQNLVPKGVKVKISTYQGAFPVVTSLFSSWYKKAEQAYEVAWGKKPIPTRDGGSIPIVSVFQKEIGAEIILMGFGLDSDAIHSPNEHFDLNRLKKGILTVAHFLS